MNKKYIFFINMDKRLKSFLNFNVAMGIEMALNQDLSNNRLILRIQGATNSANSN